MTQPSPAAAASALAQWLDPLGRLRQWPTKRSKQQTAAFYLIAKFESVRRYSESEVNEILDLWAPFRDAPLLRRRLVEKRLLGRTPDGGEYWVADA